VNRGRKRAWPLFGNIEVRGERENNLMSYTWAAYGRESVVTWTLTTSSAGTHLRMEQSGHRPDQQQAGLLAALEQVLARTLKSAGTIQT
jgi:hypothetical protein